MSDKEKTVKSSDARIFYIAVIVSVAAVQIILKVFTTLVPNAESQAFSRIIEVGMLICTAFLVRKTTFVQPWLGLKVEKSQRKGTALTCVLFIIVIVTAFIAARLILQRFSPAVAARPFFRTYLNIKHRRYYIFFVLVQEAMAKGVLQYGAEKTFPENKWYIALSASVLVFGMLHIYHSLYYIFGAMALALVSGILYHRQKNVWPSYVMHFLLAFLPRCFGLK